MHVVAGALSRSYRAVAVAALALGMTVGFIATSAPAANADPSSSQLEQQMDADWTKLEATGEQWKKNEAALEANQAQSAALGKQLQPLQTKVDAMYDRVGESSAVAYKGGKASALNSLFTAGSPTALMDQVSTLDMLASEQHKQVADYEKAAKSLSDKKSTYDKLVAANQKQAAALSKQKTQLQTDMDRMQKMYLQTAASRSSGRYGLPKNMPYIPGKPGKAVRFAIDQIGKPYVWDTAGPSTYDCSGLTMAAWAQAGVHMEHYTYDQYNAFPHVSHSELEPGDLTLWNGGEHIGIYIGQGYVIHAPQPGEVVKVSPVDEPGSWYGAVRPD